MDHFTLTDTYLESPLVVCYNINVGTQNVTSGVDTLIMLCFRIIVLLVPNNYERRMRLHYLDFVLCVRM